MAGVFKKPKLDSNGAVHEELVGMYDIGTICEHPRVLLLCACALVKILPFYTLARDHYALLQ